jgi:hypothetical protein
MQYVLVSWTLAKPVIQSSRAQYRNSYCLQRKENLKEIFIDIILILLLLVVFVFALTFHLRVYNEFKKFSVYANFVGHNLKIRTIMFVISDLQTIFHL